MTFRFNKGLLCPKRVLEIKYLPMSKDWSQYNKELVKRGEILIAPPLIKDKKEEEGKKERSKGNQQRRVVKEET